MSESQTESTIADPETYSGVGSEGMSFRQIVLQTLSHIRSLSSVEFKGGYWVQRAIPMAGAIKMEKLYVPDSREVFRNSIMYLSALCLPHFDEQMKKDEVAALKIATDEKNKEQIAEARLRSAWQLFRSLNLFLERKDYLSEETLIA